MPGNFLPVMAPPGGTAVVPRCQKVGLARATITRTRTCSSRSWLPPPSTLPPSTRRHGQPPGSDLSWRQEVVSQLKPTPRSRRPGPSHGAATGPEQSENQSIARGLRSHRAPGPWPGPRRTATLTRGDSAIRRLGQRHRAGRQAPLRGWRKTRRAPRGLLRPARPGGPTEVKAALWNERSPGLANLPSSCTARVPPPAGREVNAGVVVEDSASVPGQQGMSPATSCPPRGCSTSPKNGTGGAAEDAGVVPLCGDDAHYGQLSSTKPYSSPVNLPRHAGPPGVRVGFDHRTGSGTSRDTR